jgi:hypothetical protein
MSATVSAGAGVVKQIVEVVEDAPILPTEYLSHQLLQLSAVMRKYCSTQQEAQLETSSATLLALIDEIKPKHMSETHKRKRGTTSSISKTPPPARRKPTPRQSPAEFPRCRTKKANNNMLSPKFAEKIAVVSPAARTLDISLVRIALSNRRGVFHRQGSIAAAELLSQINQGSKQQHLLPSLETVLGELQDKNSIMYRAGIVHSVS